MKGRLLPITVCLLSATVVSQHLTPPTPPSVKSKPHPFVLAFGGLQPSLAGPEPGPEHPDAPAPPSPAPPDDSEWPDLAATLQLVANNSGMHRLNERIISDVFTGNRNEIVCTFCLLQIFSVIYKLGNDTVRTELETALDSPQLGELGDALLRAASVENSTLVGTLLGYYQQQALRACDTRQESQEAAGRQLDRSRCESIREFVSDIGREMDFSQPGTTEKINSEVERATNGKIKDLLPELPASTHMVFASALVFADEWRQRLCTEQGVFHAATGDVTTELLYIKLDLPILYGFDGVIGVSLPYKQPGIRMYLFTTNDDSDIRHRLNQTHYDQLTAVRIPYYVSTEVTLPSFDIESKKLSYADLVTDMGMGTMFNGGMGADDRLNVSLLVHKAVITTDRYGTSAAGAGPANVLLQSRGFEARIDRPFVCSLVHTDLGVPFFTAFVADPTVK